MMDMSQLVCLHLCTRMRIGMSVLGARWSMWDSQQVTQLKAKSALPVCPRLALAPRQRGVAYPARPDIWMSRKDGGVLGVGMSYAISHMDTVA